MPMSLMAILVGIRPVMKSAHMKTFLPEKPVKTAKTDFPLNEEL